MDQKVFNYLNNNYPLPKHPKFTTLPETSFLDNIIHKFIKQNESHSDISIHDIIHQNINILVPDITTQYSNDVSPQKLDSWIKLSKLYMRSIYDEFMKKCLEEENRLAYILRNKQRTEEFNILRSETIPEDIVGVIYSYLPYKTRCFLLLQKHPISKITENLYKLSATMLRGLTLSIYEKYFVKIYNITDSDVRTSITVNYKRTYKNKDQSVTLIMDLLQQLFLVKPKSLSLIYILNEMSFRLLRTLIYVTRS
jgi:hypothetical protein